MKTWVFKVTFSLTENQIKTGSATIPNATEVINVLRESSITNGVAVGCEEVLVPTFTIEELEDMGIIPKIY